MKIDQIANYVSICLIIFTMSCSAQSETNESESDTILPTAPKPTDEEKLEAERNQMQKIFTKQLELSESDSTKFWEIYYAKMDVKKKIIEDNIALKKEKAKDATEERALEMLNKRIEIKERHLAFEKVFNEALLAVISAKQIVILYRMEDAYRQKMARKRKQQQSRDRMIKNKNRSKQNNPNALKPN